MMLAVAQRIVAFCKNNLFFKIAEPAENIEPIFAERRFSFGSVSGT